MSHTRDGLTIPSELEAEMTPAVRAFVEMLLCRIEALETEVAELKGRKATPQNSSVPPSSQHPHAKPKPRRKPSGRKRGGQPGHHKAERTLIPADDCDDVVVLTPKHCRRCGEELTGSDADPLRHQVWELPEIKPLVTEYQRHRLQCPCCRTSTTAALPAGVPCGGSGPRLVAFSALLMACFRQSKRRTALFVESILNIPCSPALTVKHQNLARAALSGCYAELSAALPHSEAVNADETGTKQRNEKAWLWVAVTKRFTLFAVRLTRAAEVVAELLGEEFAGVVTSDRYAGYDGCRRRQLCWAHLKRDFQSLIDAGGTSKRIGSRLMDITHELFRHWQRYRDGTITRSTMKRNLRKLWWPTYETLEKGTLKLRGKRAGMCQHILDRVDGLWTFLEHPDVEPTNNAAERALRHGVIWRKLSFGTQSESGSRFMETMLTVIETCRQQNRNTLDFVTAATEAHFAQRRHPVSLLNL